MWATNPHTLLHAQLEEVVNGGGALLDLAKVLHNTYQPLLAMAKLKPQLHLGVIDTVTHEESADTDK